MNHLKKVIGSKVTAFFQSNYIIIIQKHKISNLAITFEPIALLRWFKSLNNFKLNMGSILFHIVDRQVAPSKSWIFSDFQIWFEIFINMNCACTKILIARVVAKDMRILTVPYFLANKPEVYTFFSKNQKSHFWKSKKNEFEI